jgi:hypothetical protein
MLCVIFTILEVIIVDKVFIFGSGATGKSILHLVEEQYSVIGFIDNNCNRWGLTIDRYEVFSPEKLKTSNFDGIVAATNAGFNEIKKQLLGMGVSKDKIINDFVEIPIKSRIVFLEKLGELFTEQSKSGSVAECGVFQGEFACEINRVFSKKKFYLFDTFTGFDKRDIAVEEKKHFSEYKEGHFSITSEELVLSKLPYAENAIIRKGYFPETAEGISDRFCFVNLDLDLYQPTLAGLEYFYPKMVAGGIILIHDYFSEGYKGVKESVKNFSIKNEGLRIFPIGDGISIGIHC